MQSMLLIDYIDRAVFCNVENILFFCYIPNTTKEQCTELFLKYASSAFCSLIFPRFVRLPYKLSPKFLQEG